MDMPQDQQGALPQQAETPDSSHQELFQLVAGRTLDALAQDGRGLDAALKADPVHGAVEYGVNALWTVEDAAQKAGQRIPMEVMLGAGMQVVKVLAGIANEKGYLQDQDIPGFLVQAFQQAVGKYVQMDASAGKITPEDMAKVKQLMGGQGADPNEAGEDPNEEATESPDQEQGEMDEPDADQQGGPSDNDQDNAMGALAMARKR